MRTSGCGRWPLQSEAPPLARLSDPAVWVEAAALFAERHPRRGDRAAEYAALLAAGDHLRIADAVVAGTYRPEPPVEGRINKRDGRKKTLYLLAPRDELLQRVLNRVLQPHVAAATPRSCHSFLPGRGPRTAFAALGAIPRIDERACVRMDVRDYFNSIDVERLLASLPPSIVDEPRLVELLAAYLRDDRVVRAGELVSVAQKGVMAGTPLGPLLGNLALADLDAAAEAEGLGWARYSDDLLALCDPSSAADVDAWLRAELAARGLEPNESKSGVSQPGEPWDFLGFRHSAGRVDLAPHTLRKLQARCDRLARRVDKARRHGELPPALAAKRFVRRLQRKLYGIDADRAAFSWAAWYFPVLTTDAGLAHADAIVQDRVRFAATGLRTRRAHKRLPYAVLRDAGYVPLVERVVGLAPGPRPPRRTSGLNRLGAWPRGGRKTTHSVVLRPRRCSAPTRRGVSPRPARRRSRPQTRRAGRRLPRARSTRPGRRRSSCRPRTWSATPPSASRPGPRAGTGRCARATTPIPIPTPASAKVPAPDAATSPSSAGPAGEVVRAGPGRARAAVRCRKSVSPAGTSAGRPPRR